MRFEYLSSLISEGKFSEFIKVIDEMNAVDAAEYLESVDDSELLKVFRLLKKDFAADIFANLDTSKQEAIVTSITDSEIKKLFDELFIVSRCSYLFSCFNNCHIGTDAYKFRCHNAAGTISRVF